MSTERFGLYGLPIRIPSVTEKVLPKIYQLIYQYQTAVGEDGTKESMEALRAFQSGGMIGGLLGLFKIAREEVNTHDWRPCPDSLASILCVSAMVLDGLTIARTGDPFKHPTADIISKLIRPGVDREPGRLFDW